MTKSAAKIQMTSFDDLFNENGAAPASKDGVREIALTELRPFRNHPFKVQDDAEMQKLVESIRENGVLTPAFARPCAEGGYELISGHRRKKACEIIGLKTMPVIVKEVDDDQAIVSMVDSNLQRENIFPSERAFAYKLKLEAMKRQGKRKDLTCGQIDHKLDGQKSRDVLGNQVGKSAKQISRFIRLTELVTPLLDMVDGKKLALNAAVELSYLKKEEQALLLGVIGKEDTAPSLSQAQRLKKYSQDGKLSEDTMEAILSEEKRSASKITLHGEKIRRYFPASYTPAQIESIIWDLLDKWKQEQGGR